LVSAPPCHGGGRGFKSRLGRVNLYQTIQRVFYKFTFVLHYFTGSLVGFNSSALSAPVVKRLLKDKKSPFVVDIGCNRGDFVKSILDVAKNSRFICIDIDRNSEIVLKDRFNETEISFIHSGVHASEGLFNVVSRGKLDRKARLGNHNPVQDSPDMANLISVSKLDTLLKNRTEPIDILKIDTEGDDFSVILGSSNCLARTDVVIFEIMFRLLKNGAEPQDIVQHLEEKGFKHIYRVTRLFGLQEVYKLWPHEIETQNLVASKKRL
jgi:FkbM family methyltransferase